MAHIVGKINNKLSLTDDMHSRLHFEILMILYRILIRDAALVDYKKSFKENLLCHIEIETHSMALWRMDSKVIIFQNYTFH